MGNPAYAEHRLGIKNAETLFRLICSRYTCLKIILMSTASNPFEIWTISSLSFNSLPRISFISFSLGNGICITFIRCSNSRGIDNTFPNIITCVDLQLRTICFIALIEHLLLLHYNPFIIVNLPLSYKNIF